MNSNLVLLSVLVGLVAPAAAQDDDIILTGKDIPEAREFVGPLYSPVVDQEVRKGSCGGYGYLIKVHHKRGSESPGSVFSELREITVIYKGTRSTIDPDLVRLPEKGRIVDISPTCDLDGRLSFAFVLWSPATEGARLAFVMLDRGVATGVVNESFDSLDDLFAFL